MGLGIDKRNMPTCSRYFFAVFLASSWDFFKNPHLPDDAVVE
jgi:hypothetical protein